MRTRVSKVQNQSQREDRNQGLRIISACRCVLRGPPDGTFVHSLRNGAFRRAGRDKAPRTFTGEYFHNMQQSSPIRRLCVRDGAERLGKRRHVTPTGGTSPFSKTKKMGF